MDGDDDKMETEADINKRLLIAIRDKQEGAIAQLLNDGADPNFRTSNIIDGKAGCLHSAVRLKNLNIVRTLLEHGAEVDIEDEDGDTPFFSSLYKEIPVDIRTLLTTYGANVNHRNKCGITALANLLESCMYLGYEFDEDTLFYLMDFCDDFLQQTTNGMSLIHYVSVVHSCSKGSGNTQEHVCVAFLNKIIQNGVDVNLLDPLGRTALHSAASVCCFEAIHFLLTNGVNINTKDMNCQTALHQIGKNPEGRNFENSLELLLKGCNINEADFFGRTPLHYTTSSERTNKIAVKLLHEHGALLNAKDKTMLNPLHMSVLPTVLVPYKDAEDDYPQKPGAVDVISYLVENGVDIDEEDSSGRTALHLATREKATEIVQHLLKLGSDIHKRTKTGDTALHRATIEADIFNIVMDACDVSMVDVNIKDNFGSTPLHWAVWYFENPVIRRLKVAGAKFHVKDHRGKTASDLACDLKHTNVYEELGILYHRNVYPLVHKAPDIPFLFEDLLMEDDDSYDPSLKQRLDFLISKIDEDQEVDSCASGSTSATSDEDEKADCVFVGGEQEQCSGREYLYPDCPLLSTIYNNKRCINLMPWKTHLEEHKSALQEFVNILVNTAPANMAMFQETPENEGIANAIKDLLDSVSEKISSDFPFFQCKCSLAGSWNEGTKTTCPSEFDYNFRLINFDKPFTIEESTTAEGEFVRFHLKDNNIYNDFSRYVDKSGYLDSRKVIRDFYKIFNDILLREDIPCHECLYIVKLLKIDKGSISSLAFRWVGPIYKDMLIEVDIVPSILPEMFSPSKIIVDSQLVRTVYEEQEIDIVFKTPSERFVRDWNTHFRISVAKLEAAVMKTLPNSVRKGYSLVKALRDTLYMPQVYQDTEDSLIKTMLSTYMLKTCFFHLLETTLINSSNKTLEYLAEETSSKATCDWARRIVKFLEESSEKNSLPAFFLSGVNLYLHESTSVCHDMYIRRAEVYCLAELVRVGTEELLA